MKYTKKRGSKASFLYKNNNFVRYGQLLLS